MKLIGIGGTDGSGKDTVGEMLAERHGWLFISIADILREEAQKRGAALRRSTLRAISTEWRRQYGLGVLVDKAMEHYKPVQSKYKGLVIASLRNPGEADEVHRLGGKVAWVDADPKVRYQRVTSRQRGAEDEVNFEEFLAEEKAQMEHHKGDHHTLNLLSVKEKADIFIENNGSDIEGFKIHAEKTLKKAQLLD